MKAFLKISITILSILFLVFGCTSDFEDINTDNAKISGNDVGKKELAQLFSRSQIEGTSWINRDNYSRMSSTIANHLAGYTACGIYAYEENQMRASWQDRGFRTMVTEGFAPLKTILDVAETEEPMAYHLALIWKVYLLHQLTDAWGPIAYTEMGNGKETIPYESQKDVYYAMFSDLRKAVDFLKEHQDENVFGGADMIYGGDIAKWVRFAGTLRLRLAIRISNVEPQKAREEAEAAVANPLAETNDHDALLSVLEWQEGGNGLPRMESFYQDVMSTSMESYMVGYNDPRLQEFFSPVEAAEEMDSPDYPEEFKSNVGGYHGMTSGFEPVYISYFRSHSNYGPRFHDGNQLVTPINIMNAAETHFLKAEGAWLGWNMGTTPKEAYERGIEVSLRQWRPDMSDSEIADYINGTTVPVAPENYPFYDPPVADLPVRFSSDLTEQYEQIMIQKWLALWPISFEAWAEYRRTRLPKIYAKKYSVNPNVDPSAGQIITRLPYPDAEVDTQPLEIEKAVQMLGGPDMETTPLWWDTNTN